MTFKTRSYMTADGMLTAVVVKTDGDSFQMTDTTPLFLTTFEPGKIYDVSPDGQSFIINEIAVGIDTSISLVLSSNAGGE